MAFVKVSPLSYLPFTTLYKPPFLSCNTGRRLAWLFSISWSSSVDPGNRKEEISPSLPVGRPSSPYSFYWTSGVWGWKSWTNVWTLDWFWKELIRSVRWRLFNCNWERCSVAPCYVRTIDKPKLRPASRRNLSGSMQRFLLDSSIRYPLYPSPNSRYKPQENSLSSKLTWNHIQTIFISQQGVCGRDKQQLLLLVPCQLLASHYDYAAYMYLHATKELNNPTLLEVPTFILLNQ
jgi:hypothetical protein